MSKKSRRARAKFKVTQPKSNSGQARSRETVAAISEPRIMKPAVSVPIVPKLTQPQHIMSELWRIAIIAGALFVAIIVLSFIIK